MEFFREGFVFEISFANSRGGVFRGGLFFGNKPNGLLIDVLRYHENAFLNLSVNVDDYNKKRDGGNAGIHCGTGE